MKWQKFYKINIFSVIFTFLCILLSLPSSASGGDFANREIIGFSPDGNLFAFEQYGIQDGSGLPYSQIFVISTNANSQVKGSPYSALPAEGEFPEIPKLEYVREKARKMAESALKPITEKGFIAATHRASEKFTDPYRISIYLGRAPHFIMPDVAAHASTMDFKVELIDFSDKLQVLPRPVTSYCDLMEDYKPIGFKLFRNAVVMHEDKTIPEDRLSLCPLDYQPVDSVFYAYRDKKTGKKKYVVAVLIRMKTLGFEGPDGRYLAVADRLN